MGGGEGEHGLEFLLAFDRRIHHLEAGYWLKFEIKRIAASKERPHGLSYSFTLHAPNGKRLVGFDNAMAFRPGAAGSSRRRRRATTGIGPSTIPAGPTPSRMPRP
jgi:hypothetical protein